MFWFFWPCGLWNLSSPTRDRTRTPCIGRRSLLTTGLPGKCLQKFLSFVSLVIPANEVPDSGLSKERYHYVISYTVFFNISQLLFASMSWLS